MAKRARKASLDTHNMQTTAVDQVITRLNQSLTQKHSDTVLQVYRPLGISTVLVVTIGKYLRLYFLMSFSQYNKMRYRAKLINNGKHFSHFTRVHLNAICISCYMSIMFNIVLIRMK